MVKPMTTGIRGHIERKKEKNACRNETGVFEERGALDNTLVHLKQI